ncbi:MAG: imidazole glycerol phosphate synthase subunit HisH [Acidimicrobiales bacterium]
MTRTRVTVVEYGLGNIRSVVNALSALDCDVRVATRPEEIGSESHLVLPGVGAFGDGMELLESGGWTEALGRAVLAGGTPLLGICLGMHLMAALGLENGPRRGLGWIEGTIDRLDSRGGTLRVPHIGWNEVATAPSSCVLYAGLEPSTDFYFLHSYALRTEEDSAVTGWCTYGDAFAASIHVGNLFGVQFHPEKSHKAGLSLLRNFLGHAQEGGC